jgi:hypothetical protein
MTAGFDLAAVEQAVTAAVDGPGGVPLVVTVFAGVPGVVHTPARRGFLRSEPECVLIGDWRYTPARDGRLRASHVVNEIVIAEEMLAPHAIGGHVARALAQVVNRHGPQSAAGVDAAVEALRAGRGY